MTEKTTSPNSAPDITPDWKNLDPNKQWRYEHEDDFGMYSGEEIRERIGYIAPEDVAESQDDSNTSLPRKNTKTGSQSKFPRPAPGLGRKGLVADQQRTVEDMLARERRSQVEGDKGLVRLDAVDRVQALKKALKRGSRSKRS